MTWFFIFSVEGSLMFQQVPLVEIDGLKLVQTKAILHYIAEKYNLHGKDIKEHVMYDPAEPPANLNLFVSVVFKSFDTFKLPH